jgi:plasmid stabilization system protein ParE
MRWLIGATKSLRAAHRYIAAESPNAAAKAAERLEVMISRLVIHTELGRPGRRPSTRELVVRGVPYIVIYRVVDPEVQILRIYLTSWNRWLAMLASFRAMLASKILPGVSLVDELPAERCQEAKRE